MTLNSHLSLSALWTHWPPEYHQYQQVPSTARTGLQAYPSHNIAKTRTDDLVQGQEYWNTGRKFLRQIHIETEQKYRKVNK